MTFYDKAQQFIEHNDIEGKLSQIAILTFADWLDRWQGSTSGDAFVLHKRPDGKLELVRANAEKGE